jgi:hypothetical protein
VTIYLSWKRTNLLGYGTSYKCKVSKSVGHRRLILWPFYLLKKYLGNLELLKIHFFPSLKWTLRVIYTGKISCKTHKDIVGDGCQNCTCHGVIGSVTINRIMPLIFFFLVKPGWGPEQREPNEAVLCLLIIIILISYYILLLNYYIINYGKPTILAETRNGTPCHLLS